MTRRCAQPARAYHPLMSSLRRNNCDHNCDQDSTGVLSLGARSSEARAMNIHPEIDDLTLEEPHDLVWSILTTRPAPQFGSRTWPWREIRSPLTLPLPPFPTPP